MNNPNSSDAADHGRMHDFSSGPGCYPDEDFAAQLAVALVRGLGLALRDGWRALTRRLGVAA